MSFKVGDIVWAIDNHYGYTCIENHWFGKVLSVHPNGTFDAVTVSAKIEGNDIYTCLRPEYFALSSHETVRQRENNRHPSKNKIVLSLDSDELDIVLIRYGQRERVAKAIFPFAFIKDKTEGMVIEGIYNLIEEALIKKLEELADD